MAVPHPFNVASNYTRFWSDWASVGCPRINPTRGSPLGGGVDMITSTISECQVASTWMPGTHFPEEQSNVTGLSRLFTSFVSGFNIVTRPLRGHSMPTHLAPPTLCQGISWKKSVWDLFNGTMQNPIVVLQLLYKLWILALWARFQFQFHSYGYSKPNLTPSHSFFTWLGWNEWLQ